MQEYIHNPYLIDGYKFDLRIYALVTRVDPLTIFVYKEGLARFATEKYDDKIIQKEDAKSAYIHLTNFAINKKNYKVPDTLPVETSSDNGKLVLYIPYSF